MAFRSSSHQPPEIPTTTILVENGGRVFNQYERDENKMAHGSEVYRCRLTSQAESQHKLIVKYVTRVKKVKTFNYNHAMKAKLAEKLATPEHNLRKEIAILKACSGRHPFIVNLFEVINDPRYDKALLVMEFLDGGPVQWRHAEAERPVLSLDQTRRIMRDVVLGLEFLHFHGIIHRDLKPANFVYVAARHHVKLVDFGISHYSIAEREAMSRGAHSPLAPLNDPTLFPESDLRRQFGTAPFMPPEVIWFPSLASTSTNSAAATSASLSEISPPRSLSLSDSHILHERPPVTKALDIWCLGVSFYCMLFGCMPFGDEGTGRYHLNSMILSEDWTAAETMGSDTVPTGSLEDSTGALGLLSGMLQKDPSKRISLASIKSHSWLLDGISSPKEWIRITTPRIYDAGFQGWMQRLIRT